MTPRRLATFSFRKTILILVFGSAAMLSSCSASVSVGTPQLSQAQVESEAANQLAAQVHQPVPTVVCPGPLDAKVGTTMSCTLTAQGATVSYPVQIVVNRVAGGQVYFTSQVGTNPISNG